jgi:hypothetical protein
MSDQSLTGWFRDDLYIETYLNQRFGQVADSRRAGAQPHLERDCARRGRMIAGDHDDVDACAPALL